LKQQYLFILLTVLAINYSYCRTPNLPNLSDSLNSNISNNILRLSFILPGIIYEYGITNNKSIKAEFNITGFAYGYFIPQIQSEFRWYYNLRKRVENNKVIDNFSGNFVSFLMGYQFGSHLPPKSNEVYYVNLEDAIYIGPTWGFQRNEKIFHFELNLGMGYFILLESKEGKLSPLIDISVGVRIWKF